MVKLIECEFATIGELMEIPNTTHKKWDHCTSQKYRRSIDAWVNLKKFELTEM